MVDCYGTKPSELPKTLPVGTTARERRWSAVGESVLHETEGQYYGRWHRAEDGRTVDTVFHPDSIDWPTVPVQSPPQEKLGECDVCGGKACRSPDGDAWSSPSAAWHQNLCLADFKPIALCKTHWLNFAIPADRDAILARRAAKEIKVGDYVSGETGEEKNRGPSVTGRFNGHDRAGKLSVLTDDRGCHWYVWTDSLRREEEPKKSGTVTNAATGVIRIVNLAPPAPERVGEDVPLIRWNVSASTELPAPKPDPYRSSRAVALALSAASWQLTQSGIATGLTKREQAKRQLTHGLMRNRDRYGQRLSLRGWPEADESDP